ncbi:MAG TPA: response regulator [Bryobacteraceae bacterium]|jgi:two-component system response regulator FlrC|nr:response regulator [Bryobacteraceae bacterium]
MRSDSSHRGQRCPVILLVDDNRDGSLARCSVLQELGFRVVSAGCGSDALEAVKQENFDLIVTDYKMSPVDGLQLIGQLRERSYRGPIILLTGFADSVGLRSENTGADIVIQKSANEIANLVRYAKRLLNHPKKPAASAKARKPRSFAAGSDG